MIKLLCGVLVALCSLVLASPALRISAHVLQADSDIGAILHVIPDDNPVSGREVRYILSFQDITNRFSLHNCDCSITYLLDGETIAHHPLDSSYATDSLNTFTFPNSGIYMLRVSGKPIEGVSFQPFTLTYTVRVASGDIQAQGMPISLWLGIAGIISLVLLAAYATENNYTRTRQKK